MKKAISIFLALALSAGLAIPALAVYETPTFTDVPKGNWAYTYVERAAEKGWVNGVGGGAFQPGGNVTYAQLATMLTQAFFSDELNTYTGNASPWYQKYCGTAAGAGLFNGTDFDNQKAGAAVNRYEMAQILYNVMQAKSKSAAPDLNAAATSTGDWSAIPEHYRSAVAVCKAGGIINGTDSNGTFGGNGNMTRAQACVVLIQLDKYIANGGSSGNQGGNQPSTNYGPVGTMSDFKVTLSLDTHKPIHDYWSQQSAEIRSLTDKDCFNALVQTMKDAEMILTKGEFGTNVRNKKVNLYYNYAMCDRTADNEALTTKAARMIEGYAYGNYAYMIGTPAYADRNANNFYTLTKVADADALAEVFAPIFAKFPANATDKQKVDICMREIVNRFDYETGTPGAGFDWLNGDTKGNCENYARAASQILAAAGIPNMQVKGGTNRGPHAWVLAYIDGAWYVIDGTCTEVGYDAILTVTEHMEIWDSSAISYNTDEIKVAKALVEASLS